MHVPTLSFPTEDQKIATVQNSFDDIRSKGRSFHWPCFLPSSRKNGFWQLRPMYCPKVPFIFLNWPKCYMWSMSSSSIPTVQFLFELFVNIVYYTTLCVYTCSITFFIQLINLCNFFSFSRVVSSDFNA